MLPRVVASFLQGVSKNIKVLRIVSDDQETLDEAFYALESFKNNPSH
jgi:hypothetical protein